MSGRDGVKVPIKMKIDVLTWVDFRLSASRRSAFDAKNWAQRGLPQSRDAFLATLRYSKLVSNLNNWQHLS